MYYCNTSKYVSKYNSYRASKLTASNFQFLGANYVFDKILTFPLTGVQTISLKTANFEKKWLLMCYFTYRSALLILTLGDKSRFLITSKFVKTNLDISILKFWKFLYFFENSFFLLINSWNKMWNKKKSFGG